VDHAAVRTARSSAAGPSSTVPSILVVDADKDTREWYRQSIVMSGCMVAEACDGGEALAKALASPPALVITALNLPLIDGYALCEILRRDPATAHVPILVVTGETRPQELERAQRMGADAVINKPSTPEHILSETRRLIAEARALRERAAAVGTTAGRQLARFDAQGSRLSKSFARFTTTTPPDAPPALLCPSCDQPLTYEQSYIGGVSARHAEQWDHFVCTACGGFQYRHRTRKLQRL